METTAESTGPAVTTEVDSEVTTAPAAGPAPAVTDADDSEDDPSLWTEKAQRAFNKLTRKNYEYASRAERAEFRAQEYERQLAELRSAPAKTETVAPSDEYPSLESVGFDPDKHAAAVAAWGAKQARDAARAELVAEREAVQRDQTEKEWGRKEAEFIKSKPDYEQKVLRPPSLGGPVITDEMADVIKSSEIGAEVAYYLAENVDKSAQIARLSPFLQAREIGRIEARLEAAKAAPPPVSKAPPPAPKLDTSAAADEKDPSTMTNKQFAKWRKQNGG